MLGNPCRNRLSEHACAALNISNFSRLQVCKSASFSQPSRNRSEKTWSQREYRNWQVRSAVLRLSARYVSIPRDRKAQPLWPSSVSPSDSQEMAASTSSKALLATFFSSAVQGSYRMNGSGDSIGVPAAVSTALTARLIRNNSLFKVQTEQFTFRGY